MPLRNAMLRHEYSLQIGDANGGVYALQHSKVPHRMLSQSWGTSHSYHLGNPESDSQPNCGMLTKKHVPTRSRSEDHHVSPSLRRICSALGRRQASPKAATTWANCAWCSSRPWCLAGVSVVSWAPGMAARMNVLAWGTVVVSWSPATSSTGTSRVASVVVASE